MKRLARHFLTLCSAVSLLLCVAVCVLWVRSYRVGDGAVWKPSADDDAYYSTYVALGRWRFDKGHWRNHAADFYRDVDAVPGYIEANAGRFGFALELLHDDTPDGHIRLVFPLWAPALLTAALPALVFAFHLRRRRTARRQRAGLCPTCGYDLRAHREGDRCPECGAPSPARTAA
jgi:hypothetical protein